MILYAVSAMSRRPYGAACDVWGARHDSRRVPARPPQGQNDRPHFGDFEGSGRPREVEWAGPRPCTSLHMSPRSLHRACMAWGRRGGRGHGTRGGQKCQNVQKSERFTDGFGGFFAIATMYTTCTIKSSVAAQSRRAHGAAPAPCALSSSEKY